MACDKGSRDRQNNKGESGHPCLVPRCKGNEGKIILPVMTDAAGEWYKFQVQVSSFICHIHDYTEIV